MKGKKAAARETKQTVRLAVRHMRALLQARAWELRLVGLPLAAHAVEMMAKKPPR